MGYASLYYPAWERRRLNGLLEGIQGYGLDVGAGRDPAPWPKLAGLPVIVRAWDLADGDATRLRGVEPETFDFVFSSHLLEHLPNPEAALQRWVEVTRKGGVLLIAVPHRDLYEQRKRLPSRWNPDGHLRYYLPDRDEPDTVGLYPWLDRLAEPLGFEVLAVQVGDWGYVAGQPNVHPRGEFQIDALIRRL